MIMIYDKIRKNNEFSNTGTGTGTFGLNAAPSSAVCYIGYDNNVSGRLALKLKGGQGLYPTPVAISNNAIVKAITLASSTALNYQLGDIFYCSDIGSPSNGEYTITVTNMGGTELVGRSVALYIPNLGANVKVMFGGEPIIETTEQASYCAVFSNLRGSTTITCVSVWKTPNIEWSPS